MNEDWANLRARASRNSESSGEGDDPPEQPEESWKEKLPKGLRTADELCVLTIEPREFVFGDWCRAGDLGYIFAPRGGGKTFLSLNLACGASTGANVGPWLGRRARKVLYLDGEMPVQDVRDRLIGLQAKGNKNLIYLNHEVLFDAGVPDPMNLASFDFQEEILNYCVENTVEVIFLDNLSCLAWGVEENNSLHWEKIQGWLLKLRRRKITTIVIHHAGRNGLMRGTSKREDAAAWIIKLEPPARYNEQSGAQFITSFMKWRCGAQPMAYDWEYAQNGDSEIVVTFKEAGLITLLVSHIDNGLEACKDLSEALGISKSRVSQIAKRAIEQGLIRKKGRNYEWIDPDTEPY